MAEEKEKWLFKWFSPQELTHYNDIEYEVPHIIIRTIHVAPIFPILENHNSGVFLINTFI